MNNIERYVEKDCEATNIIDLITSDNDFLEAFTPLLLQDRELLNMAYKKARSLSKIYEKETTLIHKRIQIYLQTNKTLLIPRNLISFENMCQELSLKYLRAEWLLLDIYNEAKIIENIELPKPIYKLSKCSDVVTKIDNSCNFDFMNK